MPHPHRCTRCESGFFLSLPAQTRLRQGGRSWVVFVETPTAGTFSLAAHHLHQQPRCPVAHTAREVLLPRHIIQSLTGDVGAVAQQSVAQRPMQRSAMLGQATMQLGHPHRGLPRGGRTPPAASAVVWVPSGPNTRVIRRGAGDPDAAARGANVSCPAGSHRPAAPPSPTSSHRHAARPPRSAMVPGRTTPSRRRPDAAGSDAHRTPVACGRCRAPSITVRTIRVDNTLPAAINASISANSTCCSLPRRPDTAAAAIGTTNPAPHCNPTSRPSGIGLGSQRTMAVLGRQRMQTPFGRLEPRLTLTPQMPLVDRIKCSDTEVLGFLGGQMITHPGFAQRRGERLRRPGRETMSRRHRVERRAAGCPFPLVAARQFPRRLPRRIRFHRAATGDELAQHRVIHPHTREKPGTDLAALRRVRAQRPGPHMGGRTLRPAYARAAYLPAPRPVSVPCGRPYPHRNRRGGH